MIFWIVLLIAVISSVTYVLIVKVDFNYRLDGVRFASGCVMAVSIAATILIALIGTAIHIDSKGTAAAMEQKRIGLEYQVENCDDFDVQRMKNLYDQIQGWNVELAKCKSNRSDILIGMFFTEAYDQFEYIEFPGR